MEAGQSAEVLSRIAERDAERKDRLAEAAAERNEETGQDAADVQRQIDSMQQKIDAQLGAVSDDTAADAGFAPVAAQLDKLQQYLAANAWLLTPYALRKGEDSTAALRQRLATAQAAKRPKKKFGFSARSKAAASAAAPAAEAAAAQQLAAGAQAASPPESAAAAEPALEEASDRVLRGLRQQTLVRRDADLAGGDFSVADVEGCTLLLLGRMSALRLRGIRGCCIVAGPVDGATYLEDVHDSTVVLAAHQVRIHTSKATRLFLHVGSSPVIEHCSGMGFGPLTGGQRALLGLPPAADAAAAANHFDNVQDFNWLKSTPSPNWRLLSDEDIASAPCPSPDNMPAAT